jgi:hypothetical protein
MRASALAIGQGIGRAPNVPRTPVNNSHLAATAGHSWPSRQCPKTGDDQGDHPGHLVVGTGVDPVTFRFSGPDVCPARRQSGDSSCLQRAFWFFEWRHSGGSLSNLLSATTAATDAMAAPTNAATKTATCKPGPNWATPAPAATEMRRISGAYLARSCRTDATHPTVPYRRASHRAMSRPVQNWATSAG